MRFAAAILFWVAGAAGTLADAPTVVARGFAQFEQACAAAISNPQNYVNGVPNPGPLGNKTVSVSPDGQVVRVVHLRESVTEDVTFVRMPQTLTVYCMTHYTDMDGESLIHGLGSHEGFQQYSKDLNEALLAYADSRADLTLFGGQTPQEYASQYGGQIQRVDFPNTYTYGFLLDADGTPVHSFLEIEAGGVGLHAVHVIEVGQ